MRKINDYRGNAADKSSRMELEMPKVSRAVARERHLTYYWPSVACNRGHWSFRYTNGGGCFMCKYTDRKNYTQRKIAPNGKAQAEARKSAEALRDEIALGKEIKEVWD